MISNCTPSKFLDPTLDVVFKLLLTRNAGLLSDMIEAVLELPAPIRELEILNPEIPEDSPGDKSIALDVRARLDNGHLIDLEMQSTAPEGTRARFLYYWAKNFVGSIARGDDYTLASADRQAKLDRWARFLRATTIEELEALAREDVIMAVAKDALERLSADPVARRMASDRETAILMHRHLINASREAGKEEGMTAGMAIERARAIVDVLQRRGVAVSDEQAERIAECRDNATLTGLWERAWTATSVDELWR